MRPIEPVPFLPLENGHIRLIDFDAKPGDPIRIHVEVTCAPEFVTLSYCWGSENCLHSFELNGQLLILPSSLWSAFREFKRRGFRGKLWADAIRINQADDEEKNVQIPLMCDIYSSASGVIAWLGEGPERSHLTDAALLRWQKLHDHAFGTKQLSGPGVTKASLIATFDLPQLESGFYEEFSDLISSPWFRRAWIFPEALLACTLTFWHGSISIAGDLFTKLVRVNAFFYLRNIVFTPLPVSRCGLSYDLMKARDQFRQGTLGSCQVLYQIRERLATFPQDRVYAVCSIMSSAVRGDVPIEVNADAERVYIRAAKSIFKNDPNCLQLFASVEPFPPNESLPSWVPDLGRNDYPYNQMHYNNANIHQRFGTAEPVLSLDDADDTLGLHGYVLDHIVERVQCEGFPKDSPEEFTFEFPHGEPSHVARRWVSSCRKLAASITTRASDLPASSTMAALARTLVFNTERPMLSTSGAKIKQPCAAYLEGLESPSFPDNSDLAALDYLRTLLFFAYHRSFFVTSKGYMGLGMNGLQPGDQILVLRGGLLALCGETEAIAL